MLSLTYNLLIVSILSGLLFKNVAPLIISLLCVPMAWQQQIIDINGTIFITGFYLLTYYYFNNSCKHIIIKISLSLSIYILMLAICLHLPPGFHNNLVLNQVFISSYSTPFSMYLNFDKTMVALILYINSGLYLRENMPDRSDMFTTAKFLLLSLTLIAPALCLGYVKFEAKIPSFIQLWIINNLFFTCFSEEIIFRGIIYNKIKEITQKKSLALFLSSIVFGILHFKGGIIYVTLSTITALIYGLTYQKTNKILCSVIVHFGLNLVHIIFFTYPSLLITK